MSFSFFDFVSYDHRIGCQRIDSFDHFEENNRRAMYTIWQVPDHKTGGSTMFILDRTTNKCTKRDVAMPLERMCIRSNHRHHLHFRLGGELECDIYRYAAPGGRDIDFVVHPTHRHHGDGVPECIPIR